jgi:pyrroline-5-carboxylate reductase
MGPDNRHTHYAKYCSAIWRVATCISFQEQHGSGQKLVSLFQNLGTIIDEKLMDAAQVLAASGTAFASLHTRQQAGIEIGFDWQTALATQTVKGAAEMLMEEQITQNN